MLFLVLINSHVAISRNPIVIALGIIGIAFLQGLLAWVTVSKWLRLAIILLFVGGMIVVFLYVTSLSANLKFRISRNKSVLILFLLLIRITYSINTPNSQIIFDPESLFFLNNRSMLISLILFLLTLLFVVVKVCESFKGALAQKFS